MKPAVKLWLLALPEWAGLCLVSPLPVLAGIGSLWFSFIPGCSAASDRSQCWHR